MRPLSVYSKYAYYLKRFGTTSKLQNMLLNRYELSKRKTTLKSRPFKITIDPGNFCNLRCPGCHTGIKHPEMITPSFLGLSDYQTIFNQFRSHALSVALYNWGEPFLNKQIFDMIAYTSENRVGSTIHSNFNLFNERMAEDAVKSGLTHIYLSIDGSTQEAYARYRVKGELDKVLKNLEILLETKKRMGSKYPLVTWKFLQFDHNIHETEMAADRAKAMGVDAFESFKAYPKLMDIYEEAADYRKDPSKFDLNGKVCSGLWSGIYVNSDGSVLPCSLAYRENESFGNLLHESLDAVWNNAKYRGARQMFSADFDASEVPLPCKACKYFVNRQCVRPI